MNTPTVWDLTDQLKDRDATVRLRALDALLKRGPEAKKATARIAAILDDPSGEVREKAVRTLVQFGPEAVTAKGVIPSLTSRLTDPEFGVRSAVLEALRTAGPAAKTAVPALLKMARSDKWYGFRCCAIELAVDLGADSQELIPIFVVMLDTFGGGPAVSIFDAIARMGKAAEGLLPKLEAQMARNHTLEVRQAAKRTREAILDASVD